MSKSRTVKDLYSVEDRVRTPVKGLRVKLRTALRAAGVVGKFRTDHLRSHGQGETLVVLSNPMMVLPFDTFQGIKVIARRYD